jgi:hypothetical protein
MASLPEVLIVFYGPINFYSIDNGRTWHYIFTEDQLKNPKTI